MPVRFRSYPFFSLEENEWLVEISDADFSGETVLEFDLAPPGVDIAWQGDAQERMVPVIGSRLTIQMYLTTAGLRNFLEDLAEGPERRYTVAVYLNGGTNPFWVGTILPDVSGEEDLEESLFTITATDGLGALKDVEYTLLDEPYSGYDNLIDIAVRCLKKINHVSAGGYWSNGDDFLITAVNWYADQHTYGATYDPLFYTLVEEEAFYKRDSNGGFEAKSCLDVLAAIAKPFGARWIFSDGMFRLEQIETRAYTGTSYWRKYVYTNSANMAAPSAYTPDADLSGNPTRPRLAGGSFGYLPALKRVKVKQHIGALRNLVGGYRFTSDDPDTGFPAPLVFCAGEDGTLYFSLKIDWKLTNVGIIGIQQITPSYLLFYIKIKIGSYYLRRTIDIQNNFVVLLGWEWTTTDSGYVFPSTVIFPLPATTESTQGTAEISGIFGMHASMTASQLMEIEIGVDSLQGGNGVDPDPSDWDVTWRAIDTIITVTYEPADKADKIDQKEYQIYSVANAETENTNVLNWETLLGDAEDLNQAGALRFDTGGGVYEATEDWGLRAAGGDGKLIEILATRIMAGQMRPVRTMQTSVTGPLAYRYAHVLRTEDGYQWLMQGGRYTAGDDTFHGNWFDLTYTDGGLVDNPPYNPGLYELTRPPGIGPFTGADSQAYAYQSVGAAAMFPTAFTTTAEALSAGAVTDFDVSDALAARLVIGDEILVVNPVTLEPIVFTVTADVIAGDTNIEATGTIPAGGMPNNSFVCYAWRNIMHNDAPGGVFGTVTSVGLTMPSAVFDVAGSPVTTSGTLAVTLDNQTANTVWAGPTTGAAAAPTFRALVSADLPAGIGTVTSVALALPTAIFDVSGSPVTSSGTLTATLDTQTANTVWAGPTAGGEATPTFRALVAADIPAGAGLTATNGITLTGSTIKWGGTLVEDTTITQAGFRIRFTGHYTGIHKGSNNPTPRAVLDVDGLAVAAPTAVSTPAEDAIANFHGTSGGTQVDTQLRIGAYSTATNGNWLQASGLTAYDTFRPLRLQPLGGKAAIGKYGATPPDAYCTIFGTGLGTSGLTASTLHVAQTGESSTTARVSLGTNNNLSTLWMYDGAAQIARHHTHVSGTTVTNRWSFGTTEFDDVMTLQPTAAASNARLGVGFANTTGLHSTVQSAGSFAGASLATAGAPTFDETKYEVFYTGTANQSWTLPSPGLVNGRVYWLNHAGTAGTITLSSSVSVGNGVTFSTLSPGEWAQIIADAGSGSWRGKKW